MSNRECCTLIIDGVTKVINANGEVFSDVRFCPSCGTTLCGEDLPYLTREQKEVVYREIEREYRLSDAERHLLNYYGFDESDDKFDCPKFEKVFGFTLEDAVNPKTNVCILGILVDLFEDAFDCNVPENCIWDVVVAKYISDCGKQ